MLIKILYWFLATCGVGLVAVATYGLFDGQSVTTALIALGGGVVIIGLSMWCLHDEEAGD